jgi:hypothetical protein
MAFSILWDEPLLQRKRKRKTERDADEGPDYQYYVYVLEASLSFRNGMGIPLMSEFLEYQPDHEEPSKQDCEQKAFHRLAARIKQAFPSDCNWSDGLSSPVFRPLAGQVAHFYSPKAQNPQGSTLLSPQITPSSRVVWNVSG